MDILLIIIGAFCLLLGFIGCFVPVLPGVTLAYLALVLMYFVGSPAMTVTLLVIGLGLVALAFILDAVIPAVGAKHFGGSRWGIWGCVLGAIVGLFFGPWGLLLGPFGGAVAGELLGGKDTSGALRAGLGAFLGFLCGTVLKIAFCGLFAYWFINAILAR